MEIWLEKLIDWLISSGLRIALIIAIGILVYKIVSVATRRFQSKLETTDPSSEASKRAKTLGSILRNFTLFIVIIIMVLTILPEFGVQTAPIIAAVGIGGLAVGFGAQNLVRDVISGFLMIVENQIRVGDVVNINGKGGMVENITLRIIRLRDLHGNVHYIPHGQVTSVTNMTKDYSRYVFDVGVSYRENVDEVIKILEEIGEGMVNDPDYKGVVLEPLEILGLDRFEDSAVIIRARITTLPLQQWRVGREFNKRMKATFDQRGIEIPFPHRTLYMGVPKGEPAPPLYVKFQDGDKIIKSQKQN